jgi:hypothetical protein
MAAGGQPDPVSGGSTPRRSRRAKVHSARASADSLISKLKDEIRRLQGALDVVLASIAAGGVGGGLGGRLSCIAASLPFVAVGVRPPLEVALRRNVAAHAPDEVLAGRSPSSLSGSDLRRVQRGVPPKLVPSDTDVRPSPVLKHEVAMLPADSEPEVVVLQVAKPPEEHEEKVEGDPKPRQENATVEGNPKPRQENARAEPEVAKSAGEAAKLPEEQGPEVAKLPADCGPEVAVASDDSVAAVSRDSSGVCSSSYMCIVAKLPVGSEPEVASLTAAVSKSLNLGAAAALLICGYPGAKNVEGFLSTPWLYWWCWLYRAGGMLPVLYIVYEVLVGFGLADAIKWDTEPEAEALFLRAQVVTLLGVLGSSVVQFLPMLGFSGLIEVVVIQAGICASYILVLCGAGLLLYYFAAEPAEACSEVEEEPEGSLTEGEVHAAAGPTTAGRSPEAAGLQPPDSFFIGEAGCTDLEDLFSFDMELMLAYGLTAVAVQPEVGCLREVFVELPAVTEQREAELVVEFEASCIF